jgi:MinD-like ATPase involved in chromosome partitioning or flagellar assembly
MGATIASKQRGMKVVALSIDPFGNLSSRVRAVNDQAPASVMSLAAENDEDLKRTSVVSSYLQTDKSGLRVLGSSTADGAAFLTPDGLRRALRVLAEQYDLSVIDFGLNIDSSVYHEGLSHVDQLVLTASTTADSIDELHTLIATLKRFGGKYVELLHGAVVVFSQTRPGKGHINIDAERTRIANSYGLPVVTIPWDAHISQGGPMSIELMDENTRLPYTWLAAEVMSKLPAD